MKSGPVGFLIVGGVLLILALIAWAAIWSGSPEGQAYQLTVTPELIRIITQATPHP